MTKQVGGKQKGRHSKKQRAKDRTDVARVSWMIPYLTNRLRITEQSSGWLLGACRAWAMWSYHYLRTCLSSPASSILISSAPVPALDRQSIKPCHAGICESALPTGVLRTR